MNMRRVPMFAWSALIGALGLLLVLPAVIGALIYTYVDYRYGRVGFGGNGHQRLDRLRVHPAGDHSSTPSRVRLRRRGDCRRQRTQVADARRHSSAGIALVGVAACTRRAAAATRRPCLATSACSTFGLWLGEVLSYGFFNLLPVLGGFIVIVGRCARPAQ